MAELVRCAGKYDGDTFVALMELHKASMYKIAMSCLRNEDIRLFRKITEIDIKLPCPACDMRRLPDWL